MRRELGASGGYARVAAYEPDADGGDEAAAMAQGLRLMVIALVSAALTAGLVIGAGTALKPQAHDLLVRVSGG